MKKNIMYIMLGVVLMLVNISINYDASSNDNSLGVFSKFEMSFSQAKAGETNNVKCKCDDGWFFPSKKCLSKFNGNDCHTVTNDSTKCQESNSNCGGKDISVG